MHCTNRGMDGDTPPPASRAPAKALFGYAMAYRVLESR